ncbi:MAG: cysteine peptidase family C39 domain-containing protein [Armatimonadota bacterium]
MGKNFENAEQTSDCDNPRIWPEIPNLVQASTFATDTIADPFSKVNPPRITNRILNYRRMQNWENYFLASAIYSVAKAMGVDEGAFKLIKAIVVDEENLKATEFEQDRAGFYFFSAITGDMFTVLYANDKPCDSGITNYFFMPQVVKKAFSTFGYDCIYLSNAQIQQDFRAVMNAVKASVDKGIPVLAWGMGNVTTFSGWHGNMPEGCLIGGYDENDLLYVNLYPGPERMTVDKDGYTAISHGLEGSRGLFFVGNPIEKPDLHEIYRRVIECIPTFLATPPADGYMFGQEALEKWADTLLDESRFAGKTDDELGGICWDVHCSPYCNICTSAADAFIETASEVYDIPLTKKLLPHYEKFVQLRKEIWALQDGFFPPMEKFRTHEFRKEIADILRRMGNICDDILKTFD